MNIGERLSKKGDKVYYYYDHGRGKSGRAATGLFSYVKPRNTIEKQHDLETKALLEVKRGRVS